MFPGAVFGNRMQVGNSSEHKEQTKEIRKLGAGIQVSSLTYELSPFPQ